MTNKSLIIIALALCLCLVLPVSAVGVYFENKYVERNAFDTQQPIDRATGTLTGSVRSGFNLFTNEIGVRNDAIPDAVNQSFQFYPIKPDGTFEIQLVPGSFTLMVVDGNGGQPEYSHATIVANTVSKPEREILGHAVPPAIGESKDKIVILKATYGMTKIVIDQAYVPAVPGTPDVYSIVNSHATHTGHADKVHGWGHYDFIVGGQKYEIDSHGDYAYLKVCGTPAIPAIPEVSHVEGTYVDVTSEVAQMTTAANPHQSFAFNNAMNPGGIVNVAQDTVLVAINDPAPGQVKNVMIKYTVNGVEITLDTMEYEQISL